MSRSKPEELDPLYFGGVCAASCVFNEILPVFWSSLLCWREPSELLTCFEMVVS